MAGCSRRQVLLLLLTLAVLLLCSESIKSKRRKKREWIIPPSKLDENEDYTHREYIAKIRSDKDIDEKVEYFLTGAGADKQPYGLFVVDHNTGFVRVTAVLDREKYPSYNLTGVAKFVNGSIAEDDIPLTVMVVDKNDNPPYFDLHTGNISEASEKGSLVMTVQGKDDDQANTINSELHYSIISQEPEGKLMFTIDAKTGELRVKEPTLDRETHDFYKLVIQGKDMGGADGGLTGTGTVEIKILDINDNVPTLEKSAYAGSVDENVKDVVVMKVKAMDKDLEFTDNWLAVFNIVKGNEDKLFSIETDKKTNEGILKLIKAVDFEEVQNLDLDLLIENVAPFVVGSAVLMDVDVKVGEGGGGAGMGAGLGAGLGLDAGLDAGLDLGLDAGLNAGLDLGLDVGLDADLDVDLEADLDADLDADLNPDLGVDLGLDAGLGVHPAGGAGPAAGASPAGGGPGPGLGAGVGVGLHPDGGLGPSRPGKKPRPKKKKKKPSYPIHISVNNLPEGPKFVPGTKEVPVSEDPGKSLDDVITTYAAIDPDTGKNAEDVNYAKAFDPDNLITVDEETAEIRLNKAPDRESSFVKNGTYIAKILAITKDMPSKTATGTIAIRVMDANDHCPELNATFENLCTTQTTIYVSATDKDMDPYGPPFTFEIVPENTRGTWKVESLTDTTAAITSQDALWRDTYTIEVAVSDAKGKACPTPEVITVDVCECGESLDADCSVKAATGDNRSLDFAGPAISLMLAAVCLLLFVPCLLVFCQCGGSNAIFADRFSELPFEAKEHLIAYHTEGKGEDKEVPLYSAPVMLGTQAKVEGGIPLLGSSNKKTTEIITNHEEISVRNVGSKFTVDGDSSYNIYRDRYSQNNGRTSFRGRTVYDQQTALFEDIALPDAFLDEYYTQKSAQPITGKDALLVYDDEGRGSPVGSVGCCSLVESDNDLQFLDDLGPKFKILADICSPTPIPQPTPTYKAMGAVKTEVTKKIAEPVVTPKVEKIIEKHADVKTEKFISSTNISKSSVNNVSTVSSPPPQPSMTLPRSQVTNITSNISTSNVSHLATLPRPPPTIVVQQPQLFYAANPMPMPMPIQYIMQPPMQNTVLLAEGRTDSKFPGYIVVGGPQIPGQAGRMTQSTTHIMKSPGISGGFTSGSLSSSPSSTVFFPGSPTTSPTSPTILLPGSPGSPGMVGMEGWKIVGPNPEGNYMLVKDKSTSSEVDNSNPGSPKGASPKGVVLKKEAAPPQGVLGNAAYSSVIGVMSGHPLTSVRGLTTVNKPFGGAWVVQPQNVGLSPVTVVGVGAGGTQNTGVNIIQSSAPVGQTNATTVPKDSRQDLKQGGGEQSFSKTLVKKGKRVPKKIQIRQSQTEVKVDHILNVVPKPHVHLMPPTFPSGTIEESTEEAKLTADLLIEQQIQITESQIVPKNTDNSELSENREDSPKCVDTIATETLEITTDNIQENVEESKDDTGLEDTNSANQEVSIELSTDTAPVDYANDDTAEDKKDQKDELLEEYVSSHVISEVIEDTAEEIASTNTPLEEDTTSVNQNTSTNSEEEVSIEIASSRDKEDEKMHQDEDKQENDGVQEHIVAEHQDLESKNSSDVVEESQMEKPNFDTQDANIHGQEVGDPEIEVDKEIPSKPQELEDSPISLVTENHCQESNANQNLESVDDSAEEVEQITEIVGDKEALDVEESTDSLPAEDTAVEQHEPLADEIITEEIYDNQDLDISENFTEEAEINTSPIVNEKDEQPENKETLDTVRTESPSEKLIPDTTLEDDEAGSASDQEHHESISEESEKDEKSPIEKEMCDLEDLKELNPDPITDIEEKDQKAQHPDVSMDDMVCEEQTSQQGAKSRPVNELASEKEEEILAERQESELDQSITESQIDALDSTEDEQEAEEQRGENIEESQQPDFEIREESNSNLNEILKDQNDSNSIVQSEGDMENVVPHDVGPLVEETEETGLDEETLKDEVATLETTVEDNEKESIGLNPEPIADIVEKDQNDDQPNDQEEKITETTPEEVED